MDSSTQLLKNEEPILQYIMLKKVENVKSILENDDSKASLLDSTKKSPLHAAAFNGTPEIAELIITTGGCELVNGKDNFWVTPLHLACQRNNFNIVSTLLQYGADVSARTKAWQTPAHYAAMNNSIESLKLLLNPPALCSYALNNNLPAKMASKADLNLGDRSGQTCLHLAAYYGFEEICRVLIENNAKPKQGDKRDRRPLHWAVLKRHQGIIKLLSDHLEDDDINLKDKEGNTALHVASTIEQDEEFDFLSAKVWVKSSSIIKHLIDSGADITVTNNSGNTVIHTACLNGNAEALPLLLKLAKEVNQHDNSTFSESSIGLDEKINKYGQTALHYASFIHEMDKLSEAPEQQNCLEILLQESKKLIPYRNHKQMTALHEAARCGSSRRIDALISAGAKIDDIDYIKRTPLHIAAHGGHYLAIDSLLRAGADCEIKDEGGRTPLHLCVKSSCLISCKKIVTWQSSNTITHYVNIKDNEGMTSLHHCAFGGSSEVLEFLISNGADVTAIDVYGRTPLHYAAANSQLQCLMILVKDSKVTVDIQDNTGCSSLHMAASKDLDGRCVEYLISRKADAWIKDIQGYTPLHYAAANGNLTAIMTLVQLEEVEISCKSESTEKIPQSFALYLAVLGMHVDCLVVLLSRFSNVVNNPPKIKGFNKLAANQTGRRTFCKNDIKIEDAVPLVIGQTLLHVACKTGNSNIVELLLENGADLFARDLSGFMRSALHYAASNGHYDCVKTLLKRNGDIMRLVNMKTSIKNSEDRKRIKCMSGKTALMEASMNGSSKIVRVLCKYGAKVNDTDSFGRTALYMAAARGREECVEILIEMNADVRKTDKLGKSALHIAAMRGHVGILGTLIDKYTETSTDDFNSAQFWYSLEDNDGFTPLQWAAFNGHEECVEILTLRSPESIVSYFNDERSSSSRSGLNFSPVHCAAAKNNVSCLRILIESLGKEALQFCDDKKRKPLHVAVMSNSYETCKILIENGAEINCQDNNNGTPLMLGSKLGNLKCVELLLSHNCEIDQVDCHGNTALHYGSEGSGVCANAILKSNQVHDADISHQNAKGQTPLHIAASRHLVDTCELLLINGASVSIKDAQGLDPVLATATSYDAQTCLTMLLVAVKQEAQTQESQTNSYSRNSLIHAVRRSISSLGSFRLSDSSSYSSRLSDASLIMPNETILNSQSKSDKKPERASFHVKKRSLPILMEDVHISVKNETNGETECKQEL